MTNNILSRLKKLTLVTALMIPMTMTGTSMAVANGENSNIFGLYLSGRYANQIGDFKNASAVLLEAVRRQMSEKNGAVTAVLYQETRDALMRAGELDGAVDLLKDLDVKEGSDRYSTMILALDAVKNEDWAKAETALGLLPQDQLSRLLKPFALAWIEAGKGNKDRALTYLNNSGMNEGLYGYAKGQILDYVGDHEGAIKAYLEPKGFEDPARLPSLTFRAYIRSLTYLGKVKEARELTRQYLQDFTNGAAIEQDLRLIMEGEKLSPLAKSPAVGLGEIIYQFGKLYAQSTNRIEILDLYRMAEFLSPDHMNIKLSIAERMERIGRLEDAVELYEKTANSYPIYWQVDIQKSDALWSLDRKKEAYDLLESLADDRPADLQALSALGLLYNRDEDYINMDKALDRLIGRINLPAQHHWIYYYRRGIAAERLENWDKAEIDFLKALELSPDEPDVLNYLGYTWVDKGLFLEKAQVMLRKAVDARRNSGAIADSLGWAYYKLEKYDEAVRMLERAVSLEPTEAIIVEHLGDAYWRIGRKREARFQWNRALKWPTFETDKVAVRQKLEEGL